MIFLHDSDFWFFLATWDSPPRPGEFGYLAFEAAFKGFLNSRTVTVPLYTKKQIAELDSRPLDGFRKKYMLKDDEQPDVGQSSQLKLMPFQVLFADCIEVLSFLTNDSS